jgi:hypothetical protein
MNKHFVWTYNDNPEWLDKNSGIADMIVVDAQPYDRAMFAAERLAERFPDATFEVRDGMGETVNTYGRVRTELRSEPVRYVPRKRRQLGTR